MNGPPEKDRAAAASQMVSWVPVLEFAQQLAAAAGIDLIAAGNALPGTPRWCGMADDDANKLLSLILGGVREALRHDTAQQCRAEASRAVSGSADWSQISREMLQRNDVYIPRKAS